MRDGRGREPDRSGSPTQDRRVRVRRGRRSPCRRGTRSRGSRCALRRPAAPAAIPMDMGGVADGKEARTLRPVDAGGPTPNLPTQPGPQN
ncbi:hypothetical protein [Mycolicibacterium mucogenicum]|uniref:hypothetical protein n=1 Tax=Mycolicibacterium mucogenicum TaxID=56689 RepID=UPI0011B45FF5|nr:hypothetical protein [Mycolicibacterium mucogenicum]